MLKPWDQRKGNRLSSCCRRCRQNSAPFRGSKCFPIMPPALPGGGNFPVEIVLLSTEEPERMLEFAKQLQAKAMAEWGFFFPPIIDTKIDQPQAEVVIDHDKVAALGLNLQQIGADLSRACSAAILSIASTSPDAAYKVIPQIKRAERLNPDQLNDIYVTGPNGKLIPLSTVATHSRENRAALVESLAAIKRGHDQRRLASCRSIRRSSSSKTKPRRILPKGYTIDYTGESRQLRVEGDKFLPAFGLAVILIFLVLAAQFNSFRDPFIILLGSVPLALFGAMIFMFENRRTRT